MLCKYIKYTMNKMHIQNDNEIIKIITILFPKREFRPNLMGTSKQKSKLIESDQLRKQSVIFAV